jgi:hypothetical protein
VSHKHAHRHTKIMQFGHKHANRHTKIMLLGHKQSHRQTKIMQFGHKRAHRHTQLGHKYAHEHNTGCWYIYGRAYENPYMGSLISTLIGTRNYENNAVWS